MYLLVITQVVSTVDRSFFSILLHIKKNLMFIIMLTNLHQLFRANYKLSYYQHDTFNSSRFTTLKQQGYEIIVTIYIYNQIN